MGVEKEFFLKDYLKKFISNKTYRICKKPGQKEHRRGIKYSFCKPIQILNGQYNMTTMPKETNTRGLRNPLIPRLIEAYRLDLSHH